MLTQKVSRPGQNPAQVLESFEHGLLIAAGPVLLATSSVALLPALVERIERELIAREQRGERSVLWAIRVYRDSYAVPAESLRTRYAQLLLVGENSLAAVAVMVDGEGLIATARASVLTGIFMLARSSFPCRLFRRMDDGERWLATAPLGLDGVAAHARSARALLESAACEGLVRPRSAGVQTLGR